MQISYRKGFVKELARTHLDVQKAFARAKEEIEQAQSLQNISNLKALKGFRGFYRIRLLDHRAVFLHLRDDGGVEFLYIAPRGEAYDKKRQKFLKDLMSFLLFVLLFLAPLC